MKPLETTTLCPHCRSLSETGTRGGCSNCRKVKHNSNGKSNATNVKR